MFKVGDILEDQITHSDQIAVAVQEEMITMYMIYRNISKTELMAFNKMPLELHLMKYKNVIVFSYSLGNMVYSDSCYNPNLSPKLSIKPFEKVGYHMLMLLVDADTGKIMSIRFQMLPVEFSNNLMNMIEEEQASQFDQNLYNANVEQLWNTYDSNKLFRDSRSISCIIKNFQITNQVMFADDMIK